MTRLLVPFALLAVSACRCGPLLPDPPLDCDSNGIGCLSDEQCVDGKCLPLPKCKADADCKSAAFQCTLPAQVCQLREGFGEECQEPDAPCDPGKFCALGVCHPSTVPPSTQCSREADCPAGQRCDLIHFFCIEDADCRLATQGFPELACDDNQVCDQQSGRCSLPCQNQCTTDDDCPQGNGVLRCNGSCQCVQCITDNDCAAGLTCGRDGLCLPSDICRTDADCNPPLVCDRASAVCQVPPPPCASDFDCALGEQCDLSTTQCIPLPSGPCQDDTLEPSNTPASAHAFVVAEGGTFVRDGLVLCPNNDDVYSVGLTAGDELTVTVTGTDDKARATVWLLDSSGETSLAFSETPPRGAGVITYVAPVDETVYIRVTALVDQTPYTIDLDRSTGETCQADFFEGQNGNDTLLTATTPVPDNVALAGTVCSGDKDLYRVDVAAGEALSASLSFDPTQTDLDIAFLDDQGNLLAQAADTAEPEVLRRRFVDAGTVYIRVTGFGNDTGSYNLVVNHEAPFQCAPDAAEPDDDVASAPVLALGQGVQPEARTLCAGDEDWIVTPLEDFERLVVVTQFQESDVQLAVDVLDAAGTTVLATSPPATNGAAVSYDARGNETVSVRIRAVGGSVGAYTLSVIKENQNTCAPDVGEPNDTVQTAKPLPDPAELLTMCTSDEDFFQIPGTAGHKIVADASFRQAEADIDLQLIGLDGTQILATADGTGDGEHLEAVLPLDGTYTLRVFSLTSPASAHYTLSVTEVTP